MTTNKNIDYISYFKDEFIKLINQLINFFDVKLVFNAIYYSFNIDIYIMTSNDKKVDLNKLSDENRKEFIIRLINHLSEFYKNEITILLQKQLINTLDEKIIDFNCNINNNDLKENIYFQFNRICKHLDNIRRPIIDIYCNKYDKMKNNKEKSFKSIKKSYKQLNYCYNKDFDFLNIGEKYYRYFKNTILIRLLINQYI